MKIAWFTPLAKMSSIGRFSAAVANSLARFTEVDLCIFDVGDVREVATQVRTFSSAASIPLRTLSEYDVVVYNLGNYLRYHREIYELSRRWPGVCVLHDFVMHHFFAEYYLEHRCDPDAYRAALERNYGSAVPGHLSRIWQTDEVVSYPLFEEVARGALGIITHSEFFRVRVARCFAGPIARIPLSCTAHPRSKETSRKELGIDQSQILLVTIGHVNSNKQIDFVLQAIRRIAATEPALIYAVVGAASPEYLRALQSMVKEFNLTGVVRFLGEVPDALLSTYLSAADICINLRFPSTEGASGSAIEEMLHGKPIVVTDTGFFAELPNDCVLKVRPNNASDLENALLHLVRDVAVRESLGIRAKTFAETEFHPDAYAKRAMDFFWEVRSANPILNLADRVGVELRKMGAHSNAAIVEFVAGEIRNTLVGEDSREQNSQENGKVSAASAATANPRSPSL
jgi:glycosyltransferase involved in cell wall biosynthesis